MTVSQTCPTPGSRPLPIMTGVDRASFERDILPAYKPIVLRGLVGEWPAVRQGSPMQTAAYLKTRASGRPVESFVGRPEIGGRFFYDDALKGLNFQRRAEPLASFVDRLLSHVEDPAPPSIYIGAAPVPDCLPGFADENTLELVGHDVVPRVWIGNATTVSTHYDLSDNIACVVAGRRRFTLFPPDQLANLYVGPLDFTLAGQPVSMVSLKNPDLERYPRFAEAMGASMTADLEPGDAIYVPPLWWHQVESLTPFNVLVNYWWNAADTPASPFEALIHAIMTVRHLPPPQREAWRGMFDHYVFERGDDPVGHLPPDRRGVLGAMSPGLAQRIRGFLMNGLRRT